MKDYLDLSREAIDIALYNTRAYSLWKIHDPGLSRPVDERYERMPFTDKSFIREAFPNGLVPYGRDLQAGLDSGDVEFIATSGTTDERVVNIWNQRWWNDSECASWKLNSVLEKECTGSHREAILTSAKNVGPLSDEAELSFEERSLDRFLFLNETGSCNSWDNKKIKRICEELERFSPDILEANPSYLAHFARMAEKSEYTPWLPKAIVLTYENPSAIHLRQIREVFPVPLISSYGTTECGYILMECEEGMLHLNSTHCRAEFIPLPDADPNLGSLAVTTFGNEWVSLLRFGTGDIVRRSGIETCPCGRMGVFIAEAVEGRAISATKAADGSLISPRLLDSRLALEPSLEAYQLVQTGNDAYCLHAISNDGKKSGKSLFEILESLYGKNSKISIDFVDEIQPEASGKFLLAKTEGSFIRK